MEDFDIFREIILTIQKLSRLCPVPLTPTPSFSAKLRNFQPLDIQIIYILLHQSYRQRWPWYHIRERQHKPLKTM